MTFDVHQLDLIVLVGSAVTILAILAVRISSRAGLPSLLIYLLMGAASASPGSASSSRTPTSPRPSGSPRWRSSWPKVA